MSLECSDPKDDDERMGLDLNDEPGALLDFLNARRRRVAKSLFWMLPRLPCHIELSVLDFLTLLLDRKLISHNVMVSNLEDGMRGVYLNRPI